MASKAGTGLHSLPKSTYIKFVKRAKMWCKTSTVNGKQVIEWFSTKPEA